MAYHTPTPMNDELYQRFLSGDPIAQTAVRNHMRAIAARVLAAPQWQFADDGMRQEKEQQAAREAIETPASTIVGAATNVMGSAVRLGLRELRKKDSINNESHPSEQVISGAALETLSSAAKEEAEAHLEECATCRRHLAAATTALRTAVTAQRLAPKPQNPVPLPANTRTQTPKRPKPKQSGKRTQNALSSLTGMLPLVALILGVGAYWYSQRANPEDILHASLANLLPAELPPTGRADELNNIGEEAVKAMKQGRCSYTARRLQISLDQDPDDLLALYYLGLANVCLRNGKEALSALNEVARNEEYPPFGLSWWLAQAQLLDGRTDEGLATLDTLADEDHPRSSYARTLAAKVREKR